MSPKWIEEIKSFMKNLIGNTADTGGTVAAGSLTAKVNAILDKNAKEETSQKILETVKGNDGRDVCLIVKDPIFKNTPVTNVTHLSIRGKGRLHGFLLQSKGNNAGVNSFSIEIDGTEYTHTSTCEGTSNNHVTYFIGKVTDMRMSGEQLFIFNTESLLPFNVFRASGRIYHETVKKDTSRKSVGAMFTTLFPIYDFITFDESLEIKITTTNPFQVYSICSLDE